jgi:glucan phosphoethanolaminetransferase (alkaline phosphatase superfamily)
VLLPGVAVVAVDVALRHARMRELSPRELVVYGATALLGIALWASLFGVAAHARGPARWLTLLLVAVLSVLAVGGQLYAYARYEAFLNDRSVLVGTSMMPSVGQQLWFDRVGFARTVLPPLVIAVGLALALRRWTRAPVRRVGALCDVATVAIVIIAFCPPKDGEQNAPPDVLYVNGMGQLLRARWDHNECVERVHPGPRSPRPVPALVARPQVPRDVLFVLTESVRASSTCVSYDPDCVYTPFSNEAAPARIPLRQMRALDSTTAISLAIVWSGLAPMESRADLHSAPLVWEYAHAAGIDTAYWTSQNLLFGNSGAWLDGVPFRHHVNATQLEANPTLETGADDGKLVTHVIGDLGNLTEPFFGVVHLSNTHYPYVIEEDPPFLPESPAGGPGYEAELKNRYQDAIYLQDRSVARLIQAVRASPFGARTVIVFLSDHGEQMREKGGAGHTVSLYDPEIRIPAWFDAPPGTMSAAELESLRALADVPVTTLDVLPTLLDLLGLWDAPQIAPMRAKMAGESLLRGGSSPDRPVVLTNCTELWMCPFKNWGAMRGTRKLIATQADHSWNCFDVGNDPGEMADLGAEACGGLQALAEGALHGRPF